MGVTCWLAVLVWLLMMQLPGEWKRLAAEKRKRAGWFIGSPCNTDRPSRRA